MASEPLAKAEAPSEDDYRELCTALEASARGRAFLAEYARRNRNVDTEMVLAGLERLEAQRRADTAAVQHMSAELRALLVAIHHARPEIDAGRPPGKVAMLAELVDLLERRIDGLVESKADEAAPGEAAEPARPQLAVVPPPDEPELPIPTPLAVAPAIAVVPAPVNAAASAAIMPEVNVFEVAPLPPLAANPAAAQPAKPAAAKIEPPPAERLRVLAPIMALSEDERLALFS
jgi:hypothetical protein